MINLNQICNHVLELTKHFFAIFDERKTEHQHCESLFLKMFTLRIFFKSCLHICCKFISSEIVAGALTPWLNIVLITEHLERRKNERVFKTNFLAISCFQSYLTFLGNVACQLSSRGGQTTAQFNLYFERGSNHVFSQNVHCFYHYHWDIQSGHHFNNVWNGIKIQ